MEVLEVKVLKEIIERVPDDYTVEFTSGKNVYKFSDKVEIDVSGKKIIFKKFSKDNNISYGELLELLNIGINEFVAKKPEVVVRDEKRDLELMDMADDCISNNDYENAIYYLNQLPHYEPALIKKADLLINTVLKNDCGVNEDYFEFWKNISYLSEACKINEEALLIKGFYLLEMGYYNMAINCYDSFLKNHNKDKRAIFGKICALNEIEEFDYVNENSYLFNPIQWTYIKSEILMVEDKPTPVIKVLNKVLKKDKNDVGAILRKAIAYYIDLKFDKALSELDQVLKIDSNNLDAIILKGEILTGLHKYDEAIKTFNKLPSESLPTGYKRLIGYINEFEENNAGFFGTFKFESHWEYVYVESDIFKRLKSKYIDELEIEVLKRGLIWKGINRSLQMKSTTQNKINHALSTELLYDFDDRGYDNMVPISENSINIFNNILKSEPDNIIALNNKGCILLKLDKLDEALVCFRQALTIDSNDYHIWFNKAFVYLNGGEYYHAKDCFDKYFELNNVPNEDLAFHLQEVGWELYESNRYSESIKCYDLCIKFNPNISNFWNCKAISQTDIGQFDEALLNYNKALEIEPDDEIIIGNKISCLKQYINYQKDYLKAIECFKELLSMKNYIGYELEPKLRNLIEFYIDLGAFHFENQNYLSAIKCFNLILPIVLDKGIRENILLYKYKCFIEMILNETNESSMTCQLYLISCLKELVEINPNNIIYFEDLIYNLMSINEFDEAIEYCEKGIEIHPNLENLKKLCVQYQNDG